MSHLPTRSRRVRARLALAVALALVVPLTGPTVSPAQAAPARAPIPAAAAVPTDDWLHVQGNKIVDEAGNHVYRLEGDAISQSGLNTKCANGNNRDFVTLVSNLPTGDLDTLDAAYTLTVTNTGNGKKG